eukprot:scaffold127570_cov28-Tisochrysis_lutea.AAC.4
MCYGEQAWSERRPCPTGVRIGERTEERRPCEAVGAKPVAQVQNDRRVWAGCLTARDGLAEVVEHRRSAVSTGNRGLPNRKEALSVASARSTQARVVRRRRPASAGGAKREVRVPTAGSTIRPAISPRAAALAGGGRRQKERIGGSAPRTLALSTAIAQGRRPAESSPPAEGGHKPDGEKRSGSSSGFLLDAGGGALGRHAVYVRERSPLLLRCQSSARASEREGRGGSHR